MVASEVGSRRMLLERGLEVGEQRQPLQEAVGWWSTAGGRLTLPRHHLGGELADLERIRRCHRREFCTEATPSHAD